MKKMLVLLVALAALFAIACTEKPEKPVCGEGLITVEEAQWIEGTPGTSGYCNTPKWHGLVVYKHDGNSANCSLKNEYNFLHQWPWRWDQTIQGSWVPGTPATDGHWTDPVCKAPEPIYGCMDPLALNYDATATVDDQSCEYAPPPAMCKYEGLENLPADDPLCVPPPIPTPDPPKHCKVQGDIWYECNSGAWLYGTGILRDCVWCGGLTGRRVVRESYDCGEHYTWYDYGHRVDDPPQPLGRYACPGNCK